jgi:hypothetical protein
MDPELELAAQQAGYKAAFTYSGGLARQGCDLFAIARIPVTDTDQGVRFGALLTERRTTKMEKHE